MVGRVAVFGEVGSSGEWQWPRPALPSYHWPLWPLVSNASRRPGAKRLTGCLVSQLFHSFSGITALLHAACCLSLVVCCLSCFTSSSSIFATLLNSRETRQLSLAAFEYTSTQVRCYLSLVALLPSPRHHDSVTQRIGQLHPAP